MKRRSGSRKSVQGRRTPSPKARKESIAPARADHSAEQFDRLKHERDEALEQQTATFDVLKVISSSPGDLEPVFKAILQSAVRLCGAKFGTLYLRDGDGFRASAMYNAPPAFADQRAGLVHPSPSTTLWRAAQQKQPVQTADITASRGYLEGGPWETSTVSLGGYRSVLSVPMLHGAELIGVITIFRQEPGPFNDNQIKPLSNFAAQAVIAIENTRLLSELRQRTDDLTESLEQQTATSDVLKVISSSPGNMKPVFEAMLANALRICEAKFGHILLYDGERYHAAHLHDVPLSYREFWEQHSPMRPGPNTAIGRLARTKQIVHIRDLKADSAYAEREPLRVVTVDQAGARTLLAVPMVKGNQLVGAFIIYRQEVRSFTDKQIALVSNFAAQAVIAIENARLLTELHQRTDDLTESLEQQTATSKVLEVISSSPSELDSVFNSILENAVHLCGAKFGNLYLREDDGFRAAAMYKAPPAYVEQRVGIVHPSPNTTIAQVAQTKQPAQIADITKLPEYLAGDPWLVSAVSLGGYRSTLCVPMLHEDELIGGITIFRQEAGLFADKQTELLTNFAKQAVIAIKNARLLNELRESLERQTATSEVLKVISSSPGELEPVFQAMLENATRICEAKFGTLFGFDGKAFHRAAGIGAPSALDEFQRRLGPFLPESGSLLDRALQTRLVAHSADYAAEAVTAPPVTLGGARSTVAVPMLKDDELVGAIVIYRQEIKPFTDKQIELVKNFAAQAVIAIENTRLLNELRQRTNDLSEALEQQTATSEILRVISGSAGELEPVFQAMLTNATRMCDAAFGSMLLMEDDRFRRVAIHNAPPIFAGFHKKMPVVNPQQIHDLKVLIETKQPVHILDAAAESTDSPIVKYAGARTLLIVPLLKDDGLLGAIGIYRQEVRPFTDKQIALVQNFAAQAVIAIENARLLSELRETLERQTATSEVLKVISSSPGELDPVFDAMLENATRICEAKFGNLFLLEGERYRAVAVQGEPHYAQFYRGNPVVEVEDTVGIPLDRVRRTKQRLHILDMRQDASYLAGNRRIAALVDSAGARTFLSVPLLKEGEFIGAIAIYRQEIRPFTEKQIELVENFAAQAVIAIENTRLLNELRQRTDDLTEALDQQTATSDVLQVISSSPGDLEPVFQSMLENATRLCEAKFGILFRVKDGAASPEAMLGVPEPIRELVRRGQFRPSENAPIMRAARTKQIIHVVDFSKEPAYIARDPMVVVGVEAVGIRTLLVVPMFKDDEFIGSITIFRQEVSPFSNKQIELVANFAKQAVIAIENTRLLSELREIFAATDRHRRRAQGHQPFGVRSADCARYPAQVGGPPLSGRSLIHLFARR